MNLVLWIIAVVLAVAFLAAGLMKLLRPKEKLAAAGMGWTEDFSPGMVKLIGALEVLAAIGLVLPAALGVAPVLVPLAALGLVLLMAGAAITHSAGGSSRRSGSTWCCWCSPRWLFGDVSGHTRFRREADF